MAKLNFNIERECKICGKVFRAKTLDSLYCSEKCSKVAWKRRHDADIVAERMRKIAECGEDLTAFITVSEASDLYNIPKTTLYRLLRKGRIPGIKIGTRTAGESAGEEAGHMGTHPRVQESRSGVLHHRAFQPLQKP